MEIHWAPSAIHVNPLRVPHGSPTGPGGFLWFSGGQKCYIPMLRLENEYVHCFFHMVFVFDWVFWWSEGYRRRPKREDSVNAHHGCSLRPCGWDGAPLAIHVRPLRVPHGSPTGPNGFLWFSAGGQKCYIPMLRLENEYLHWFFPHGFRF